jgi:long-chain acyl-CoA synthetase
MAKRHVHFRRLRSAHDEDLGEEVKAVVRPMPGVRPTAEFAEQLIAFCRRHLAHIKCLRSIHFEDELP